MSKWDEFKQAISDPTPDKLAALEYKSYFAQIIGTFVVCVVLIYRGFWWVIFALIFNVGVSVSQGITSYRKYKFIVSLQKPEEPKDYVNEKSPTRRRSKIIKYVWGTKPALLTSVIAVIAPYFVLPELNKWIYGIVYMFSIIITYIIVYFFIIFFFANMVYKKKVKGGVINGEK